MKERRRKVKISKEDNSNKKKIKICIIIIFIIMFAIAALTVFASYRKRSTNKVDDKKSTVSIEKEDDIPISEADTSKEDTEEAYTESITIPGYSDWTITKKSPSVRLKNPEDNTVYMVYTISENDNIIYKTKAIKPGNMIELNLKELLSVGEHDLSIQIETYDITTEESCNGSTQTIKCEVK